MPWKMIFTRTAQAAAIAFVTTTALGALHVYQQRPTNHVQWTDRNRWEK